MSEATKPPGGSEKEQPHFSARVPEKVARGVYSSAQVVIDGPKDVMLDFLMGLTRPYSVVARVIMVPQTLTEFANALERNIDLYVQQYGQPQAPPQPANPNRPTLEEIYENFKLPEDMMAGTYTQAVLIGHSATEFVFDFFSNFPPNPAVGARVYLPAGIAPRFLNTLKQTLARYQQRFGNNQSGGEQTPPT